MLADKNTHTHTGTHTHWAVGNYGDLDDSGCWNRRGASLLPWWDAVASLRAQKLLAVCQAHGKVSGDDTEDQLSLKDRAVLLLLKPSRFGSQYVTSGVELIAASHTQQASLYTGFSKA